MVWAPSGVPLGSWWLSQAGAAVLAQQENDCVLRHAFTGTSPRTPTMPLFQPPM
jgi:hypothetical protein